MGEETGDDALREYLAELDPELRPLVRGLDAELRAAAEAEGARFDVAIKYQILMYTIGGRWRHWVCAIDAGRAGPGGLRNGTGSGRGVALRFLYGVILDDPLKVLRAGSSVLKTWDLPRTGPLDPVGVRRYVGEAVRRHPEYLARSEEILAANGSKASDASDASKASNTAPRKGRARGGRAGEGSR